MWGYNWGYYLGLTNRYPQICPAENVDLQTEKDLAFIRQDIDPIKKDLENRNNEKHDAANSFQFVSSLRRPHPQQGPPIDTESS